MTEESILREALAKPLAERAAFLDVACQGLPSLRATIEAQIAARDEPLPPFENTRTYGSNSEERATVDLPSKVASEGIVVAGRYTLLEKIGEGGMGEVWVAKQTEPIKRRVAIKLIKQGMDSRTVLARFEQERQALAMMDHPNIARVLDGGMTDTRQPFFVMELVNGLSLSRYCDESKLSIRERLELFIPICQAVQHAHQKGIVHRDLKPSNILVTMIDGRPVPKVIDFGVAKATGGKLTDETMATHFGAVIGTLEYMSPEQASFSGADVDTRADIYSLGVILYELLTGRRPFESTVLRKVAFDEMIRLIREEEPSRPSVRMSTDAALPSLAALRQIEPKRLTKLLRGELDWVIMKCLEKQRDRRYESASGLAREIQRYLSDEPVEARPPSASYRLRKFAKRNKGRVAAAGFILLALIGGMIGTTYGFLRAEDEKHRAISEQQKAEKARDDADASAVAEKKAKLEAQEEQRHAEKARKTTLEQRQLALDTVRDVLFVVDENMKHNKKLVPLRMQIIQRMLTDVDRIRDHAVKNPLEDRTEAMAFIRIGEIYFKANRIQDSVEWYTKAYNVLKAMVDEYPEDPNALRNLATSENFLGDALWRTGNGAKALELHADALRLRKLRKTMLGNAARAEDLIDADYLSAESHAFVAYDELRLGEPAKAVVNYTAADAMYARLPPQFSNSLRVRRARCEIQVRLGDAYSRLNQMGFAQKHYLGALEERESILERIRPDSPDAFHVKTDVGQSRMYLGDYYFMARRDYPAALAQYLQSHKIFDDLLKQDVDNLDMQQRVGASHYRLGMTWEKMGSIQSVGGMTPFVALKNQAFNESLRLRRSLAALDIHDASSQVDKLLSLARAGRYDEAEQNIKILLERNDDDRQVLFQVACVLSIMSAANDERASKWRERCFQIFDLLIDLGWRDPAAFEFDPDLDAIRGDKRFAEFLRRIKPKE